MKTCSEPVTGCTPEVLFMVLHKAAMAKLTGVADLEVVKANVSSSVEGNIPESTLVK